MKTFPKVTQERALQILQEGNARFVAGKRDHPHEFLTRAQETAEYGQRPIATFLSCSDSRVPLEIIFDQNIGDLFSIRVVGNICRDSQLGSIEFGVKYAETQLCVVLGHTKCGAITAACTGQGLEENIQALMQSITPALERAEALTGKTGSEIIEVCCLENVFVQIETMFKKSSVLRQAAICGELSIIGAVYDIETGLVTFLGPHPRNDRLVHGIND
ncbi:MAG: carbonic anhydrase [Planctomycetaceae bacterium]|nr:carbonic anhydrase [Planctomycetaceae bacterium]